MIRFRLKNRRDSVVAVVHPPDENGKMIMEQLARTGCRNALIWPPPEKLATKFDVAFLGLVFDHQEEIKAMLKRSKKTGPTIIGVVNYENPAMLELLLDVNAMAATSKPVKSFGALTNLVVVRAIWQQQIANKEHITRLEQRIKGDKTVAKANESVLNNFYLSEFACEQVGSSGRRSQGGVLFWQKACTFELAYEAEKAASGTRRSPARSPGRDDRHAPRVGETRRADRLGSVRA